MCARLQLQLQLSNPCRQSRRQRLSRRPPRPPYTNHAHAHEISRINYSNLISFKYTHPLGCSTACLLAWHVCMFVPPPPHSPALPMKNLKIFAAKFSRPHRVVLRVGGEKGEPSCLRDYNSRQKLLPIKIVGWALILCHDALGSAHSPPSFLPSKCPTCRVIRWRVLRSLQEGVEGQPFVQTIFS